MEIEHPFQDLFETFGRLPLSHAEEVNKGAYQSLRTLLNVPTSRAGRSILLRAPRAGHGKTHMLTRLQNELAASHEFIPLQATLGSEINSATVVDDALRRLFRTLPASGGLCMLDMVARRLFALSLQTLVSNGEVPCQDREGALMALRNRPIETFDFQHPNAVTAKWVRDNFSVLGQRIGMDLANRCNLPLREVAFWTDALFRFAATPADNPLRMKVLLENVYNSNPSESVMADRLQAQLGLLSLLVRVVLVADDLEGFSADPEAALRFAAFVGSIRQAVGQVDIIVSINEDVWENAFLPRLSAGLADRLSEVVVELKPLRENEMVALLDSRSPGLGEIVYSKLDQKKAGTHARGIIHAAGVAWMEASAKDQELIQDDFDAPVAPAPVVAAPAKAMEPQHPEADVAKESPFSVATEAPSWPAPEFKPAPEPEKAAETPVAAPATNEAQAVEEAPAVVETVEPAPAQHSDLQPVAPAATAAATAAAPSESPFSIASGSPFMADAPSVQPAQEQAEPVVSVSSTSPFQVAEPAPEPAPVFESPAPAAEPQDFASGSPFQPADVQQTPAHDPAAGIYGTSQASSMVPQAPQQPAADHVPEAASETDRVDDLLKQFRERYGKGNA